MRTHTQLKIFFAGVLISLTSVNAPAQGMLRGQSQIPAVVAPPQDAREHVVLAAPMSQGSSVSFLPVVTYDPGGQSLFVAIADVNGDGNPDLLVGNTGLAEGLIGVLLGKGDGTFQPVVTYNSGGSLAYSVAIADVNGDGKPDLLVANCGPIGINACVQGNGVLGVLLGNGDGTFQPVVTYSSGGFFSVALAVADVNRDGKPDVLVANECGTDSSCTSGSVSVLLGNGDGTFQVATHSDPINGGLDSLAVSDINGDGRLDLLVANGGNNNNTGVLLGNGDGTFKPVVFYSSGGNSALSVVVADVNRDGNPDLLVGNTCDKNNCALGSVGVLLGNGDGTFQSAVSYDPGGSGARSVAAADVNGDGKPDLIVANSFYNTVGVMLGNGDGTFQTATTYDSGGMGPFSVAVADLNGDKKPDVAVANFCGGTNCLPGHVGVLLNNTTLGKSTTSTSLISSLNPSTYGQKVTWTATVTSSGLITPTGKVKFTWSIYTIGSALLDSSGVATFSRSNFNADSYPLTAVYVGDAANLGSTSAVLNQVVLQTTTSATLISSPNPSTQGQAVTFTATISSPTVVPTGPVTFTAGKTVLGKGQLSGRKAKLTISALAVGSTKVTATYYGNSNIAKSSASVTQVVR